MKAYFRLYSFRDTENGQPVRHVKLMVRRESQDAFRHTGELIMPEQEYQAFRQLLAAGEKSVAEQK